VKLKHVIIGVGAGVLGMHRPALALDTVELVGASDVNAALGEKNASELGCPFFADYREMLSKTKPDVAVLLVPHPFHASLAIDCLKAGAHVLVEKPMAVQISEADAMLAAAQKNNKLLGVSFQQRFRPEVRAAYDLLCAGHLGKLQHVHVQINWFRTRAYFQSASWRATWRGEGGGVLMNQGIHDLDVLCYLLGSPKQVKTPCRRCSSGRTVVWDHFTPARLRQGLRTFSSLKAQKARFASRQEKSAARSLTCR
jgi:predicted dehydrogenase